MQWYYAIDGQRFGPVSDQDLAQLIDRGTISDDTLVWHQQMANWQPWREVAGTVTLPEAGVGAPPLPRLAGAPAAVADPGAELQYGGFWLRFVAKLIDGFILGFVGFFVLGYLSRDLMPLVEQMDQANPDPELVFEILRIYAKVYFINQALMLAYYWFFLAKFAATPGKLAVGLRVVRADGSDLSHGRIIGRFLAEKLSALLLYIGYIIAAFDDEKRALHDMICDTRVIKKR